MPTDFDSLKASLQTWTERTYDAPQLAEFIALAEAGLRRKLMGYQREITTSLLADTDGNIALPADFIGMRSVYYGTVPYKYSISGDTLNVIDGGGYTLDVTYFGKLPALSDSTPTNWLMDEAADIYLAMCKAMIHAFEEDEQRAAVFEAKAYGMLGDLNLQNTLAQYSRSGLVPQGPTP